ncbi:hypothetical protein GCM10027440_38400 [Nocardiopsis coralliicola]
MPAPGAFDARFRAQADSALLAGIWAEPRGAGYPREAAPFSACTWPVLGAAAASLRPPHGGVLVDMGCGLGRVWWATALLRGALARPSRRSPQSTGKKPALTPSSALRRVHQDTARDERHPPHTPSAAQACGSPAPPPPA